MPRYVVVSMSVGKSWRVHLAGCRDIKRDLRDAIGKPFETEADSIEALIAYELESLVASGAEGWTRDDFSIAPCALEH